LFIFLNLFGLGTTISFRPLLWPNPIDVYLLLLFTCRTVAAPLPASVYPFPFFSFGAGL